VIVVDSDVLIDALRGRDPAATARRALERQGRPIGMANYLIAGICLARSAELLTGNRAQFERVPGLRLADFEPG
jgi:tRNA(fMet)-specific endonuclease VapC